MSNARTLANIINSSSQIVVPSGGVNFGTSTDGSGTVTSGVLDDYEEGTWTPQITRSTSNPSGTPSSSEALGSYTKIGGMVHVRGKVSFNGFSGGSGQWRCSLPFTHSNYGIQYNTLVSGLHKGRVYMDGDSTDRQFRIFAGNDFVNLIIPSIVDYYTSNTTHLIWEFSGTYLIQG